MASLIALVCFLYWRSVQQDKLKMNQSFIQNNWKVEFFFSFWESFGHNRVSGSWSQSNGEPLVQVYSSQIYMSKKYQQKNIIFL